MITENGKTMLAVHTFKDDYRSVGAVKFKGEIIEEGDCKFNIFRLFSPRTLRFPSSGQTVGAGSAPLVDH